MFLKLHFIYPALQGDSYLWTWTWKRTRQQLPLKLSNETIDLEDIPVEEVSEKLKCTREGLSSDEVKKRLVLFGYNKLEEKKESKILKFLGFMRNPLSWVMEAAAFMVITLPHGGGKDINYYDFVVILALLLLNSTISSIGENNAGNAAAALMARLAPKGKVLLDGKWNEEDASVLVPGDIISIKLGDIIPADAALTGESLPVTKNPGDGVYYNSTCKQGEIEAVVIATGVHTFFGKAAHLVETTTHVGHFQKVLTAIGNFCICSIAVGMVIELIFLAGVQHKRYRPVIDNLLVILIGGIPIAMPTVLSVTLAIGSHHLSQQGAITKRMTAIEEMAGMDVLCSDKTGTLTPNKLTVDKNLIEVFPDGVDKDLVILMAARASRLENQDAIDAAIVSRLGDPKEEIPAGTKDSPGGLWEFVGLLTLFDPPRHDSAEAIKRALDLGVNVKMITGDQLAIGKETGRRLGMGTNMYPSSSLLGDKKNEAVGALPVDELIEQADGFAGVFPEHKYEIVKPLQAKKHIVGMTGDRVNDAPALKVADIGIAVADSTDAARSASDIVLTEPGLSVIISAVLTSRAIFRRVKNCTYSDKPHIFSYDFVLGTIMTISKDRVKPSPVPESWKLSEIFATGIVIGTYIALATLLFFLTAFKQISSTLKQHLPDDLLGRVSPPCYCVCAAQLIASVISAHATWKFTGIKVIGWGWVGVLWLYNLLSLMLPDPIKFAVRYALSGRA
ncbi:hypothetical protein SLEP1_g8945 [Rubroshorea leprosula]|uniref:Cation-transporting P-type ATPase N-terminal domain-containing protein n=1 Tax=Rubroshorea leprosula TaxID=152421 RepID=A0AAV5I916_9ROSI|nr:hypothetical protein SLEP1_g8945 [Rubroshorea leprosula]